MSGIAPTIEVSVILREMRLHIANAFSEFDGLFKKEALAALEAAMTDENIARLMKSEADNFIKDVIGRVFSDWNLKEAVAKKVARNLEERITGK